MARKYSWLVVVGLIAVGIYVVLRVLGGGGGVPPAGQDSPQAVLRKAQRALSEGQKARFVECCAVRSSNYTAAAEALFDYVQAAYRLRDALRGTYGKEAWETLVSRQADPARFTAFVWPRDEDVAAAAKITVNGDEARVELAADAEPLMLKLEGVWRIEAFPHGSGVRARRDALARAAETLRAAREDVGKPGTPLEDLAANVRRNLPGDL
ncbi:MAG: nuclear transport factor 2 family protein [Planctomycetes bacterium]|nr:nuclear transport factor 2 family protein [Planctomycetota bacterium]